MARGSGTVYDAIVVGCGPVGVIAAHLLGRQGLRTLVLERDFEPYDMPRAVHFDHEIMRILQSADLAELVLPLLEIPQGSVHFGCDWAPIRPFRRMRPDSAFGWAEDYFFYQPDLERVLRDALAGVESVEVRLGHAVTAVRQDADEAVVEAEHEGTPLAFSARYVLACDGGRSTIRRALGIMLEDLGFDEPWIVVDAIVDGRVAMPSFSGLPDDVDLQKVMFIVGDPERPTTYVPSAGNHRRWEFMLLPGETPEDIGHPESVRRLLQPWVGGQPYRLIRASVYRFHSLVARRWREGRVFLLGDAAHQTPPFFGQGLCHGIRDAANLAWKLGFDLRGRGSPDLLSTYEAERRPHARSVIETSIRTGQYVCTLDRQMAEKRDREMRLAPQEPRRPSIIPPLTAGVIGCGGIDAVRGVRFIQSKVERGTLLDDATGGGFVALTLTPGGFDACAAGGLKSFLIAPPLAPAPQREPFLVDRDGQLGAWLDAVGAQGVIVRPDGYVFGAFADVEQARGLANELRRWLH